MPAVKRGVCGCKSGCEYFSERFRGRISGRPVPVRAKRQAPVRVSTVEATRQSLAGNHARSVLVDQN